MESPLASSSSPEAPSPPSNGVLIEVRNLVKHFGPIRAVDGISFQARRGDILGFLGPNGAGKTTAMRMLTCFLEPDAGTIHVAGFDTAEDPLSVRQRIGYLPEHAPAYGEMTVTDFLAFVAEARAVNDPRDALARVVASTGLDEVLHQTIDTLSKGFKRRVGLAQALIHDPQILILDEPTDGLDPNQKALVHHLIDELSESRCILLSTHILDEVERVCNRAMIISEGRILVDSTPGELIARAPNHNVIRLSLAATAPELPARIEAQPWCDRVLADGEHRLDIYPVGGTNHLTDLLALVGDAEIQSIHLQEGRLDQLFREITRGVSR